MDPLYSESYQYDACGYLTAQSLPEEAFSDVSQRYAAGHRLAQQNDEWFEYDSGGRMIRRIVRGESFRPQIYTYKWNGRSQLTGFIKPNGERWRYRYDALGRRTEKWCGQELRTRYIWDGDTPALIQEYRNGGLVSVRHLVFNGFHLLAQQDCEFGDDDGNSSGERWQTRYAATDLNALPLALYSEEGNRVWRRDRTSLWGLRANKFYYQPEDKLDPGLLFAGQMEDSESGLVYNHFRYYHPESGTYLSPDPIGLAGGENTQAYVPNPLSWVDPLGLAACPTSLTRAQRQARINVLTEANAYRRLKEMQDAVPAAHFLDKHGAQKSLSEQIARAATGRNPATGAIEKIPTAATRFFSHRDQLNAIQRAQTIYRQAGRTAAEQMITYERWIGDGVRKGTLEYSVCHGAKVWFDKTGNVITAFPVWGS